MAMNSDVIARVKKATHERMGFTLLTGTWLLVGAIFSGVASFLGNPIAGALGLTVTYLWDTRECVKQHQKTKDDPSGPVGHLGWWFVRSVLYVSVIALTFIFAREKPEGSGGPYATYWDQFRHGFAHMDASVAKTMAGISGALSILYGLVGMAAWAVGHRVHKKRVRRSAHSHGRH